MGNKIFEKVDKMMLKQLEILDKIDIKDKSFNDTKEKAKTIILIADKIIQSQTAQLKNDIWQHSKQYSINRKTALNTASYIAIDNQSNTELDIDENE